MKFTPFQSGAERREGFTLIEIMIVVAIMLVILGIGIPSVFRSMKKDPLKQAVSDIVEGCSHARAQAILTGEPMVFVISSDGSFSVSKAPKRENLAPKTGAAALEINEADYADPLESSPSSFSALMDKDVGVELLFVNFKDQIDLEKAEVHFYQNGMSDEFTIILNWSNSNRTKITLDPITGLTDTEIMQ